METKLKGQHHQDSSSSTQPEPIPPSSTKRLDAQLEFLLAADALKRVERRTRLRDGSRRENSAEHSWHLALGLMVFEEYAREQNLNLLRTLQMALVHDLVEIDAGDTSLYDLDAQKTKVEREQIAANELFGMLPEDQNLKFRALWEEFEEKQTPESKFAGVLDRLLPVLLCFSTGGRGWREDGVRVEQVRALVLPELEAAPHLKEYVEALLDEASERGFFG